MEGTPKPSDQLPEEQPAEAVPDDVDEDRDEAESSEERVREPHGDHDDRTPATGSPADDAEAAD